MSVCPPSPPLSFLWPPLPLKSILQQQQEVAEMGAAALAGGSSGDVSVSGARAGGAATAGEAAIGGEEPDLSK